MIDLAFEDFNVNKRSFVGEMIKNYKPGLSINSVVPWNEFSDQDFDGYDGNKSTLTNLFGWFTIVLDINESVLAYRFDGNGNLIQTFGQKNEGTALTTYQVFGMFDRIEFPDGGVHSYSMVGWKIEQERNIPGGLPFLQGSDITFQIGGVSFDGSNSLTALVPLDKWYDVGVDVAHLVANGIEGNIEFKLPKTMAVFTDDYPIPNILQFNCFWETFAANEVDAGANWEVIGRVYDVNLVGGAVLNFNH